MTFSPGKPAMSCAPVSTLIPGTTFFAASSSANDVVEAHLDGEMDVLAASPGLHGVVTAAEAVIESARIRIVEDPIRFGDLVEEGPRRQIPEIDVG